MNDHEEFEKCFRMSVKNFEVLFELVGNRLQKQNHISAPIIPQIRLALTLQYLGHGGSSFTNSLHCRVGRSTLYAIIGETCEVITAVLMRLYMQLPSSEQWLQIAFDFEQKWNFPHCLGALDGKHMRITRPPHGNSTFYNYKKFHSLVLMALSDAHCRITWFTLGDAGSFSDCRVFNNSTFYKKLINNQLNIPRPAVLPGSNISAPYVIVADEIFGLESNLMKPYNRMLLQSVDQRIFNYRLSRARFTIECAFGLLCSKWQLLTNALSYKIVNTKNIISSCLCLHNFLITNNTDNIQVQNYVRPMEVEEGIIRSGVNTRQNFCNYFTNEEAKPWQNNYI